MPLVQRYERIIQGAMVLTGNALVTRRNSPWSTGDPAADLFQSGAYISTNTSLQVPGYPPGTTGNYLNNSSMAILNVLPNSTVEFAQLMWVVEAAPAGTENNPVNFTTPAGTTGVAPTLFDTIGARNWKAADVTTLIQNGINTQPINGQYTVGAVPGRTLTQPPSTVTSMAWGLVVVYQNNTLPLRYFNVNTGFERVTSTEQLTFNFTGIVTPISGPITGYLLMNYSDGDLLDEAQVRVGENAGSAVQIGNASNPWNGLTPYSRINNMLPGNVLIGDTEDPNIGLLDTRGTFGNINIDPYTNTAPSAARNIYDIAGYNISNTLVNNQTNLYTNITFIGTGSALVQSQSVQIDVNAPRITPTKAVNATTADVGDALTYTITFTNNGTANADNVVITDTIQNETTYIPLSFSITGNTATVSGPNPLVITLDNSVAVGETVTIEFDVDINSLPIPTTVQNTAEIAYSFNPGGGLPPQPVTVDTNTTSVFINNADLIITKTDNPDPVVAGTLLTYTLSINNVGPSNAVNVNLTDIVPVCVTNPEFSTDSGATWNPWNGGPLSIGTITPTTTIIVLIRGIIDVSCSGTITNTATVNSITADPIPATRTTTEDTAIVQIDFGDCPDTSLGTGAGNYRTLLSNDGPRHIMGSPLLIGIDITAEPDGLQNPTATGDVDDGLTLPLPDMRLTDTTYSLDVPFTNNTGITANIYAWLDFNNNGVFEGNEAVVETITSDSTNPRIVTLTFTKPTSDVLTLGLYFLRIRVTTDNLINANAGDLTLEDTRSFGLANDGEVEDYSFNVVPLTITICHKQSIYKCYTDKDTIGEG